MIRIILYGIIAYLLYRLVRRLFLPPRGGVKDTRNKQNDRRDEDIQKRMRGKIEDADFEDIE